MNTATTGILATPIINKDKASITLNIEHIDMSHLKDSQTQLDRIYELLGCRNIDIVRVRTKNTDIYIDDEGLFVKNNPVITLAFDTKTSPLQLAGTLLFSNGSDDEGETVWFDKNKVSDLTKIKDIEESLKNYYLLGFANN